MGGLMSREKGKRGEREVIGILQPVVSQVYTAFDLEAPRLQRNTLQSHGGGFDVVGLDWMALEVKFHKDLNVAAWWRQTLAQCGHRQVPVLFYRRNNVEWKVRCLVTMQAGGTWLTMPATMSVQDWLRWFRAKLVEEVSNITD